MRSCPWRSELLEIDEHRRAVVLAGAGWRATRPAARLDREAHDGLVDRADLLDVERPIGQPFAPCRALQRHQPFEDAQNAAVGDGSRRAAARPASARPSRNGNASGSNSFPPRAWIEAGCVAFVDEPEEREQPAPAAAPLIHGVGIERGILGELGVEAADGIARLVDCRAPAVGARGQQVAILGVENEDQPHQDGEQALVEMLGPVARPDRGSAPARRRPIRAAAHAARRAPARRARWKPRPAPRGSSSSSAGRRRSEASAKRRKESSSSLRPPSIGRPGNRARARRSGNVR